jgi:hypothetical protein
LRVFTLGIPFGVARCSKASAKLSGGSQVIALALTVRDLLEAFGVLPAWTTLDALAGLLDLGPLEDELGDALAEAEADRLIQTWDGPDGPSIALTPLGASRAGLRLTDDGERWMSLNEPWQAIRCTPEAGSEHASTLAGNEWDHNGYLDSFPDPAACEAMVDVAFAEMQTDTLPLEPDAGRSHPFFHYWAKPIHILGSTVIWGAATGEKTCSGCGGRPLSTDQYCCRCDSTGLSAFLPPLSAHDLKRLAGTEDARRTAEEKRREEARAASKPAKGSRASKGRPKGPKGKRTTSKARKGA